MKPNATLEDYQKRDLYLVDYLEKMIARCNRDIEKYPHNFETDFKRKAYKDILFKLTKDV